MKIIRAKDYYDMSRKAANIISAQVIMKPNCVLGLATGGTPVGTYKQLVEWYNKGDLDFAEVNTVNLDEYRVLGRGAQGADRAVQLSRVRAVADGVRANRTDVGGQCLRHRRSTVQLGVAEAGRAENVVEVVMCHHDLGDDTAGQRADICCDVGRFEKSCAAIDQHDSVSALHQTHTDVAERQPATPDTAAERFPVVVHLDQNSR